MTLRLPSPADRQRSLARLDALRDRPVAICGGGIYAREVAAFLRLHGIEPAGCFVDEAWLAGPHTCGEPVSSLAALRERHPRLHAVIGFCGDPAPVAARLRQTGAFERIEFFDCRWFDRFAGFSPAGLEDMRAGLERLHDGFADERSRATLAQYLQAKATYDGSGLKPLLSPRQYFPDDLPAFLPGADDIFADGGAYTGDTLAVVFQLTGRRGCRRYHAFEPDAANADRLAERVRVDGIPGVALHRLGLWDRPTTLRFAAGNLSSSGIGAEGAVEIPVDTLDNLAGDATCIKFDLEGAELEALRGAAGTIARNAPRLAICLYHRAEHLLGVPELIRSIHPGYRFALRIHSLMSEELVLYGRVP